MTRSPGAKPSTAGPAAMTSPANSSPRISNSGLRPGWG